MALAALPFPTAAAAGPLPHAPISITSDAGFTGPNGVVAGTGTAADPYVISGWAIESSAAAAIRIVGTTKHVLVQGNVLSGGSGIFVLDVRDNAGTVVVRDNLVDHRGVGVFAQNGRVVLDDNTVRDTSATLHGTGVYVKNSHAYVGNSTFIDNDRAMRFQNADADVVGALVVSGLEGVLVDGGEARISGGEFQVAADAVEAIGSADVTVASTLLTLPARGVVAQSSVVTLDTVRIDGAKTRAVELLDSRAYVGSLEVVGGAAGVLVRGGRADVATSDVRDVRGTALAYVSAAGSVDASTFLRNGGGVSIDGGSVVALTASVFTSNAWGVGIDYASRASIPLLSGNVVNGIPLAGVYHAMEANVVFSASVDSGHSAGYYGSLTREGALVLYDVQEAHVTGTLAHGTVGVHAVNSFNVVVEGAALLSNDCGVVFNGTVGFVKNTTIDIPVDPPATCGVKVRAGFAGIVNNTILRADVGVDVAAGAKANVTGNLVAEAQVGIRIDGGAFHHVRVEANVVVDNVVGIEISNGSRAVLANNTIEANVWAGVQVRGGAAFTFEGNVVVDNLRGLEDLTACVEAEGAVRFEDNLVANNTEFGVTLNGTVVMRNNRVEGNGGDGAVVCGRVEGRFDVFADNGADGLEVHGSAQLEAEAFVDNRFGAGLRIRGTLFVVLMANVSGNFDGIIGTEPLPELPDLPPLPPVTVPPIGVPSIPDVPDLPCFCPNPDPLWIHLSIIERNARFAISASPQTDVNATANYWGGGAPDVWIPQFGEFGNVVSPNVRFVPWFEDRAMTERAPV